MEGIETAVIDAPVETTAVTEPAEASGETIEESQGTPAGQENPDQPDKQDRRQNPDALRKTLKWLRENGGEHSAQAQAIERILGESKSYKTVYPTVREAREARQAIDAVGGVQKIAELQQSITRYQDIDARLEAGDASVIDDILETGGKGLTKILPTLIEKLGEADAAGIQAVMRPHAVKFMESQGLVNAIDSMVASFNEGKPDEAKAWLARIVQWYKGLGPKANPEQEAWQKERDQMHQERYQEKVSATFNQIISHAETVLDKQLSADIKRLGLSPEQAQLLKEDAWKKLEKLRNADSVFDKNKDTKFNDKTRQVAADAATFVNRYTDRFAEEACAWAVRMRYGHLKGTVAAPGAATVKPNPTVAPGTPVALDHSATLAKLGKRGSEDAILRGEGYTKDGKKIIKQNGKWKYA